MQPFMNEDAAWQRLIDMQREMENDRLWAGESWRLLKLAAGLARRLWVLAGLAMRRPPRRRPFAAPTAGRESA